MGGDVELCIGKSVRTSSQAGHFAGQGGDEGGGIGQLGTVEDEDLKVSKDVYIIRTVWSSQGSSNLEEGNQVGARHLSKHIAFRKSLIGFLSTASRTAQAAAAACHAHHVGEQH